jgi:hypothetical protein
MNTFDVENYLLQCSDEFNKIYPITSKLNIQQQRFKSYAFLNIIPAFVLKHLSKFNKLTYKNKQIKNIEIYNIASFIRNNTFILYSNGSHESHNWITLIFDDDKHDPFEYWRSERSLLNVDLTGPALRNNAMINNIPFYTWGNEYGTNSTSDKFEYYIACYETSPVINELKEILCQYVVDYHQYKGLGYEEILYKGFPLLEQLCKRCCYKRNFPPNPLQQTKFISGRRLIWLEYFNKCIQLAYNDKVNLNMLINDLLPECEKSEEWRWPNHFKEDKHWF